MNKYKIVFVDIDGTLRNDLKEITHKTKEVFNKLNSLGIIIVICSGRPTDFAVDISKSCNASKYVIVSNGANVYDYENDKEIFYNKMSVSSCIKLYNIAMLHNARFIMHSLNRRVVSYIKYFDGSEILLNVPIKEFLLKNDVSQCTISSSELKTIKIIKEEIKDIEDIGIKNQSKSLIDPSIPLKSSAYIDISKIDTSKGLGIKKLLEHLNIKKEESIGIGDDNNDIPMFHEVGLKIAMSNSFDSIKSIADIVTDDNNHDGVANALIKIFDLEV